MLIDVTASTLRLPMGSTWCMWRQTTNAGELIRLTACKPSPHYRSTHFQTSWGLLKTCLVALSTVDICMGTVNQKWECIHATQSSTLQQSCQVAQGQATALWYRKCNWWGKFTFGYSHLVDTSVDLHVLHPPAHIYLNTTSLVPRKFVGA